jgi:hypothetical protein
MGRGLSELQCWILREASARPDGSLRYAEICCGFFGWTPDCRYEDGEFFREHPRTHRRSEVLPGEHKFSREDIGARRYQAVMASLSRACKRLQHRGLATCIYGMYAHWSGVEITAQGRTYLSGNLKNNSTNS